MSFNDFDAVARFAHASRARLATLAAGALLLTAPRTALVAQSPTATPRGEDAATIPSGLLRVRVLPTWTRASERWTVDATGRRLIPLGGELTADSLGVAQLPELDASEQAIRTLTGASDFRLSAGRATSAASARTVVLPITLEYGLTRRLQLGVTVPIVQSRVRYQHALNDASVRAPLARPFNVGVAPATSAGRDQLLQQIGNALARLDACAGAGAGCSLDPAAATSVRQSLTATRAAVQQLYGTGTAGGRRLVPLAGSATQQLIDDRLAALSTQTTALLGAAFAIDARPDYAQGPVGTAFLDERFATAGYDSVGQATRVGVGDVEIGAKALLLDGPGANASRGLRLAALALVRLGTGSPSTLAAPLDDPTGDGQFDVEGGVIADLLLTRWAALTTSLRYTAQLGETTGRFPDAFGDVDVLAPRPALVTPGDRIALELVPRLRLAPQFTIDGYYTLDRTGAASYLSNETESSAPAERATGTATTLHSAGIGVSYSTLQSWSRGAARLPVEIVFSHLQTVASSGGPAWKTSGQQLQVRLYYRLFR